MPYTINKSDGTELVVLEDGTIDTTTSVGLVGRNYVGYGETQNENFLWLLENFASTGAPSRPIKGQTWFNATTSILNVYDGATWHPVGTATPADTPPESAANGELWLKTPINQLFVRYAGEWRFIGPEDVEGFGAPTRFRSTIIKDSAGFDNPVIILTIAGTVVGICTRRAFTINVATPIEGFGNLVAGVNLSSLTKFKGDIEGNSSSATRLETTRTINGVGFNGTANITITSNTTNKLLKGSYLTGSDFDGSSAVTLGVDASSANIIGKVVVRNSAGGFAAGTITADLVGDVTGNVTADSGVSRFDTVEANLFVGASLTGNAFSATKLQTPRLINNVSFDGTKDITLTSSAQTLTGSFINPTVTTSSLTSVGTLGSLKVADPGIQVGGGNQLKMFTDTLNGYPTIRVQATNTRLNFDLTDTAQPSGITDISFIPSSESLSLGGLNAPALIPDTENATNLGHPTAKWNKVYANNFLGNADTATLATSATNIAGGGAGSIPYQTAIGATSMVPAGSVGQLLSSQGSATPTWITPSTSSTANSVVIRDSSGNFAANTITANLTGNVSGNATTVTNGVYTTGAYNNPAWITGLAGTKVTNIPNSSLVNSSITINGSPVSLGGAITVSGGFGVGQSHVNVTSSRSLGGVYTNTTGKTIQCDVFVTSGDNDYDDPYQWAVAFVNGVEVTRQIWTQAWSSGAAPVWITLNFFVPPGATYQVNFYTTDEPVNAPSYGCQVSRWTEFR